MKTLSCLHKNRKSITRTIAIALLVASPGAFAYDWNAETGFFQWLFGRQGYFTPKSGHTLATACAFDEASKAAAKDPALKAAMEQAFTSAVPNGMNQIEYSVPYQLVTFGNWGNEIFTNTRLEGRASHEDAGEFLKGRYHKWLASEGAQKVYLHAQTGEGYSSTYYLHSQAIDGVSQDDSFKAIELHVKNTIAASIGKLQEADKKNIGLPTFTGAFKGLGPKDCNERCQGMAFLGSIFHQMEDSSASCSDAAIAALKAKGLPACVKGDGHTIIDWTSAGRPQVVTLSNDEFYQGRTDVHGNIDGLYTSCDTKAFSHRNAAGQTWDFNPKYINSKIMTEVAKAVAAGENPQAAADRIWKDVVSSRFASKENRKPMPPPAPATTSGFGKKLNEFGHWLGELPTQKYTNKLWNGLGRFVAWVDHKYGDADGWNEGVASAWGSSGGNNVGRNASTTVAGTTGPVADTTNAKAAGFRRD